MVPNDVGAVVFVVEAVVPNDVGAVVLVGISGAEEVAEIGIRVELEV